MVNDRAAYLAGVVGVRTMTLGASPYGALHMLGNVQEWTQTVHTMRGVVYPGLRTIKGGSCYTQLDLFRLHSPGFAPGPEYRTGFRCAKTVRQ